MKTIIHGVWFCCVMMIVAGCVTYREYQQDLDAAKGTGVSPVIYEKMRKGRVLHLPEIVELLQKKYPEDRLIRYLVYSGGVYRLTTVDIDYLRKAKVSDNVINYLLKTPEMSLEEELKQERIYRWHYDYRYPLWHRYPYYYPYYYY
jgi:hypothetical protein